MISARELQAQICDGGVSAEAVCQQALSAIAQADGLGAFLYVATESALAQARAIDQKRKAGEPLGPLAGVPVGVKDLLTTRDAPTSCGSRMLTRDNRLETAWRAPYDAAVVERLRASDAVIIGKTNLDEFAMGSSSENSAFFPVRNPWDPSRAPGGSSGGSAVSVAAALCPLALGTDTGGSIRQPAAFCGVVGLKPSYGRVSRYGLVAFASSLDVIGPFARDVRDAARLFDSIAGHDPRDSTSSELAYEPTEAALGDAANEQSYAALKGLRVGIPEEYFQAGLDTEVEQSVREAVRRLAAAGAVLSKVSLPHTSYGVATYYLLATAEASSNLARFDGVRFGLRRESPSADLIAQYAETRGGGFGREVKRRIMLGTYALSTGYYDAYYKKAQQVRALILADFDAAFQEVDVLLTPTTPSPAFRLGEKLKDPLTMYLADVYTLPASLAGLPAISLPCGFTKATDAQPALPIGVQLIGPAFSERRLLGAASWLEHLVADQVSLSCPGASALSTNLKATPEQAPHQHSPQVSGLGVG